MVNIFIRNFCIIGAIFLSLIQICVARSSIKQDVYIQDNKIYLSDIFTNIDEDKAIMDAPLAGDNTVLSTHQLMTIARTHKLDTQIPTTLKRIIINRKNHLVPLSDLNQIITSSLKTAINHDNFHYSLHHHNQRLTLAYPYTKDNIKVSDISYNEQRENFTLMLKLPVALDQYREHKVTGRIKPLVKMPVLGRDLKRYDIITPQDIQWKLIEQRKINKKYLKRLNLIINKSVKRHLRQGQMLSQTDLTAPLYVKKGQMVTTQYHSGSITLSMIAKALDNGAQGTIIRLQNTTSHQTFKATVTAPNRATITQSTSYLHTALNQ